MQSAVETEQSLSVERKLKLHEARESIIGRLAADLPTSIISMSGVEAWTRYI